MQAEHRHPKASRSHAAYLRSLELGRQTSVESKEKAIALLEHAAEIDQESPAVYALLVYLHAYLYYNGVIADDTRTKAEEALNRVRDLAPGSITQEIAEAHILSGITGDHQAALEILERLGPPYDGSAEVLSAIACSKRQLGRFQEAIGCSQQSLNAPRLCTQFGGEIDDLAFSARTWEDIARCYRALRRFADAEAYYAMAAEADPADVTALGELALTSIQGTRLRALTPDVVARARHQLTASPIAREPDLRFAGLLLDLYQTSLVSRHEAGELYRRQAERVPIDRPDEFTYKDNFFWRDIEVLRQAGLETQAEALLESSLARLIAKIESSGGSALYHAFLGIAHALAGNRVPAVAAGETAVAHTQGDAYNGPFQSELLAVIYTLIGDHERALDTLEPLVDLSYRDAVSAVDLRLDPIWTPLREQPRFQRFVTALDDQNSN